MSTNKNTAKVDKLFNITSKKHLYEILSHKDETKSNLELTNFVYLYDKWRFGCPCDDKENENIVDEQYKIVQEDPDSVYLLCQIIGCSKLIFA